MLAMTAVIVDYAFKMCFWLSILQAGANPNVVGPVVIYPLLSLSSGLGALITR